ncbi:MAG: aminotransferase class V-fold PLP-dependent enzyme [Actinobacteria bacterium]|nr:aminotransferase class V-fold PLP-dependent enzyme [Actinomycetota bacterium]NCZ73029.1 aminotransferase class V-fold PLP-dependent enzyme [Actinomycetota bacterium]NDA41005.1 aminotransferase class V-fold PLP-dependent enzyme [Actinomycetota bacterium]NDB30831.1 aminotransferase class V-fold PLP-dependent enzyme [Actinomycetota bacterium]NDC51854.1 aminotransferase class V-fold PLP-dependent enzyme [Actinomycetota bacterium]
MERKIAEELDKADPLRSFRDEFLIVDPDTCYLDGNSLGRLPHSTIKAINSFMVEEWGREVVTGWSHWVDEAQSTGDLIGRSALGAAAGQVLACDTTSVNFYQLASAAIQARPGRKTIVTDAANFPTDRYVLQGLAKTFGLHLVMIENENPSISANELITPELLEQYLSDDVALVSLEVVQYRAGARHDIRAINALVEKYGALMLWDAAHAIGSVQMNFDDNGVNLAVGCTYKYGNSGPGAPAWLYVSKAMQSELRVPIQGWFAQRDQFAMGREFDREESIRGFQIASPSLMGLRCVRSSFEMIERAGIGAIEKKAAAGTAMMITLFDNWLSPLGFSLNTPRDAHKRGAHISLVHPEAEQIAIALRQLKNVIPDYRVPNSIRVAISPLANSFAEIYEGFARIRDLVASGDYKKAKSGLSRVT